VFPKIIVRIGSQGTRTNFSLCRHFIFAQVGLDTLQDLALNDIKNKISTSNIITEMFSKFTSKNPDILTMEDAVFSEICSKSETMNMIKGLIQNMSEGEDPHRSVTLNFLLRRIIVSSKPLVRLLCPLGCWHAMSSLHLFLYCPTHYGTPRYATPMLCGFCRKSRPNNTKICVHCWARFIER